MLIILTRPAWGGGAKYCDQHVCVSAGISQKPHVWTSQNFLYMLNQSSCDNSGEMKMLTFTTLCTSVFVDDVVSSVNREYVVYREAYIQGMSDSWRQHMKLCHSALPPADWHPSAMSLAMHSGDCLWWDWWQTVCCAWVKVCYPWLLCWTCLWCYVYVWQQTNSRFLFNWPVFQCSALVRLGSC